MTIEIEDFGDSRLLPYLSLTDRQLRNGSSSLPGGIFIAESPKVIASALRRGLQPLSLLCERKHITGDAKEIIENLGDDIPVFTGPRQLLESLTGYTLTRGVLCAMRRPQLPAISDICTDNGLICLIHGVCDATNIGAIYRSAAAFGVSGIVLSRNSCDPLNRRSIRVSMGTVFDIPWTFSNDPIASLKAFGYKTAALALNKPSLKLDNPLLKTESKLAVVLGTEGDGLPESVIKQCDYKVIIPMHYGVDSLNVATAAAIAFWELRGAEAK